MRNYSSYEVGNSYAEFQRAEGCQFDMTDSGAVMILSFENPTEQEILEHQSDQALEVGLTRFNGAVIFTAKFGSLPWIDMPYHPQLASCSHLDNLMTGQGYSLQVFLVDCITGTLKNMRYVGLSTEFSIALKATHESMLGSAFDQATYNACLNDIYSNYSTPDIANMATASFRIGGAEGAAIEYLPELLNGYDQDSIVGNSRRPETALSSLLKKYPSLPKDIASLYLQRGKPLTWPNDVFLPWAAWDTLRRKLLQPPIFTTNDPLGYIVETHQIVALGSWRYAKGIYSFSKEFFNALINSPLPEILPLSVFRRLPDWCPYLMLPEPINGTYGYYCWLDHDDGYTLYILPDRDDVSSAIPIDIGRGLSLYDATMYYTRELVSKQEAEAMEDDDAKMAALDLIEPAIHFLLYLCSDEPEIDDSLEPGVSPSRIRPTKTKKGNQLFAPNKVRTWIVGSKISHILTTETVSADGRKAPHLRRGHWHLYWIGPRNGEQTPIFHWLPPTTVNAELACDDNLTTEV